jgi:hypothetical protein
MDHLNVLPCGQTQVRSVHDVVAALLKDSKEKRRSSLSTTTTKKAKTLWSKLTGKSNSNGRKKQWSSTSDLTRSVCVTPERNATSPVDVVDNEKTIVSESIAGQIRRRFSNAQFDHKDALLRRRTKSQFIPPEKLKALQDQLKVPCYCTIMFSFVRVYVCMCVYACVYACVCVCVCVRIS